MIEKSIDLTYLKSISLGSRSFELRLLKTFVEQTTPGIKYIRESNEQQDWDRISSLSHKIRPSFHFVGALKTEALLQTIEDIVREKNDLKKIPGLVNTFLKSSEYILEKVKLEIEKYNKLTE